MTENSTPHYPITETRYCYCLSCMRQAADYLNRWADENYNREAKEAAKKSMEKFSGLIERLK